MYPPVIWMDLHNLIILQTEQSNPLQLFKTKLKKLTCILFQTTHNREYNRPFSNRPLSNYVSVPMNNNLKSRLQARKYSKCKKTIYL